MDTVARSVQQEHHALLSLLPALPPDTLPPVTSLPQASPTLPGTLLVEVLDRWAKASGPAPGTIRKYRGGLRRLEEFGITTIADACDRSKLAHFYESRRVVAAANTANTDLTAATVLVSYLEQSDGSVPTGTAATLRGVRRRPKRVTRVRLVVLELEEVEAIARAAAAISPKLELAIWLAYWAGLRLCEFRRVTRAHLDLGDKPVVRVLWEVEELGDDGRIKTWREREVPLEAPIKKLLLERAPEAGHLFGALRRYSHGRERKLVSPDWLRRNLNKAAQNAGITRTKVDWMLLRRSCACRWINAGIPEQDVVEAMGHTPETFRQFYKQMRGGYSESFETTSPPSVPRREKDSIRSSSARELLALARSSPHIGHVSLERMPAEVTL